MHAKLCGLSGLKQKGKKKDKKKKRRIESGAKGARKGVAMTAYATKIWPVQLYAVSTHGLLASKIDFELLDRPVKKLAFYLS